MEISVSHNCQKINWEMLMALLKSSDMGTYTATLHQKAFENSYRTIFLYDGDELVGCGRLLSDGAYQGAIYDVAVDEGYRGHGLGRLIMDELLKGLENLNLLLYASPGKEPFYEKFGFRAAKTAMIRFQNPAWMEKKGFL